MRICLILEGCYPYVNGGVSSWMHNYINEMTEHEFVLVTIGANAESRGNFKYELADNVVEVKEVFWMMLSKFLGILTSKKSLTIRRDKH